MKKTIIQLVGIITYIGTVFINFSYAQETSIPWQILFNEKNFNNFEQLNGDAKYVIENGAIVGTSKLNTPNSFLATKKKYSDFILEFEVFVENGLNSGVQFRSISDPEINKGRVQNKKNYKLFFCGYQ